MRKSLIDEINELENKVFEMANIINNMILIYNNYEEVLKLEDIVNRTEMDIELFAIKILALYQPEAIDLRRIITAIKVNNDLERIADHIENISRDLHLVRGETIVDLTSLIEKVMDAYKNSIDAYKNRNSKLAKETMKCDQNIDIQRDNLIRQIVEHIMQYPKDTYIALKNLSIIQNLERIADLSTNICEDVIFLVEGKIYKHGREL
ncbi:MAG: hypothetical protein N2504_04800 [candidate division WOR-3 bacterium]|nr:hypothetical protein [candidate division WOR-3 bacterium]MCX7947888.1 hypothetical protein [candidate division WOR-3 bacterium]MDW8150710.1 PhoU domain-containing protein [candidate division WOR-3 bacterium]